jgi:hypothetical protein
VPKKERNYVNVEHFLGSESKRSFEAAGYLFKCAFIQLGFISGKSYRAYICEAPNTVEWLFVAPTASINIKRYI